MTPAPIPARLPPTLRRVLAALCACGPCDNITLARAPGWEGVKCHGAVYRLRTMGLAARAGSYEEAGSYDATEAGRFAMKFRSDPEPAKGVAAEPCPLFDLMEALP